MATPKSMKATGRRWPRGSSGKIPSASKPAASSRQTSMPDSTHCASVSRIRNQNKRPSRLSTLSWSDNGCGTSRFITARHPGRVIDAQSEECRVVMRDCKLLLNYVFFLADDKGQQFVLLGLGNFVLVEGLDQVLGGRVPVVFGNSQSGVRGFHIAAHVNARPAGGGAELIQDVLAQTLL